MYAVEFSHRSGRDLINVAKKRTNIIPIIEDARHPHKYRMLVGKSLEKALATEIHSVWMQRWVLSWAFNFSGLPLEKCHVKAGNFVEL